MKTGNKIR
ncbi:hypothetical protein NXF25_016019 [Crotalus adamanteus]|uniref:Uncharacterized protein n=1 Tax=Crotalus adamanteus TaxID=8729 RepID=A0AAW1AWQ0_CROAD